MAKRMPPKQTSVPRGKRLAPLRAALTKLTKEQLIDLVLEWAGGNRATLNALELRFGVKPPLDELVARTRQAIADATDFDQRQINHNFAYDRGAYETVERSFERLVKDGQLEQAMELSLELMRLGSYQVEMSDEGLMTQDIEDCLEVVLRAVDKSKLPPATIVAWCDALRKNDRVNFILDSKIDAVRNRLIKS